MLFLILASIISSPLQGLQHYFKSRSVELDYFHATDRKIAAQSELLCQKLNRLWALNRRLFAQKMACTASPTPEQKLLWKSAAQITISQQRTLLTNLRLILFKLKTHESNLKWALPKRGFSRDLCLIPSTLKLHDHRVLLWRKWKAGVDIVYRGRFLWRFTNSKVLPL